MRFAEPIDWRILDWPGHKILADFSFTLYAIHNPTLMLLRSTTTAVLGTDWIAAAASPVQWVALATAMTVTIGLAYALSRVTEAKVGAARRWVKSVEDALKQKFSEISEELSGADKFDEIVAQLTKKKKA